jgi:hypothetical protein
MLNFGILLKSYDKDFELAERLIASFNMFNPEQIQMFVVVPDSDLVRFNVFRSETITVLSESLLGEYLVDTEVAGIRPGYINQEIIKLAFWELGLCENYFCVDSDAVFIRPLTRDDFMYDATTPYTVLVEDNELKSEPRYFDQHWKGREPQLRKIQELVGLDDRRLLTCHGHQVFSGAVLRSMKHEFMSDRDWSYQDILESSPYEFSWYNFWLQKSEAIPIIVREPLVKVFHNEVQLALTQIQGITETDMARGYLGYVVNSNFIPEGSIVEFRGSAAAALATFLNSRELVTALYLRFNRRVQLIASVTIARLKPLNFRK